MIYPKEFPSSSSNNAEEKVFHKISSEEKYDVYYSRKFVALTTIERPEYEIDFIICIPNRAIICLEVKGGIIRFDGINGKWFQNSHNLSPGPDAQASSATHSLISRYKELARDIPFGWALCFPDCEIPYGVELPPLLPRDKIIDQQSLLYLDKALNSIFQSLFDQYPDKTGCKNWQYNNFKNDVLRGIGFVQVLGTRVRHDNDRFLQLVEDQVEVFKHVIENNKIIVYGPAGSGKTIVAKTLAQEAASEEKKVFLCCFNRTLSNKLSYEPGIRNNDLITVNTFHSFAKRTIEEIDLDWWQQAKTNEEDFWDIEVPAKLDALPKAEPQYDYLIIDEGQDFKEFWFELLFRLLKKDGKIIIFLDRLQDIFNRHVVIPNESIFFKYTLKENCRNTKKIVEYLERIVGESILTKNIPIGEDVIIHECKNSTEIQRQLNYDIQELLKEHRISSDQILIITNSEKSESSISNLTKIANLPIKSLDNKGRMDIDTVYYTSINTFKGLEIDVVLIIDVHLIKIEDRKKVLYTEGSRAKHKLYTYEVKTKS